MVDVERAVPGRGDEAFRWRVVDYGGGGGIVRGKCSECRGFQVDPSTRQ